MRSWLKDKHAKDMAVTDAAWLAGFFDGEGTVCTYKGGRGGKYLSLGLWIPNTDLPALHKCRHITGVGNISDKSDAKRLGTKPSYVWRVSSQRDIISLLVQMLPYLIVKREKAQTIVDKWQDVELKKITPTTCGAVVS